MENAPKALGGFGALVFVRLRQQLQRGMRNLLGNLASGAGQGEDFAALVARVGRGGDESAFEEGTQRAPQILLAYLKQSDQRRHRHFGFEREVREQPLLRGADAVLLKEPVLGGVDVLRGGVKEADAEPEFVLAEEEGGRRECGTHIDLSARFGAAFQHIFCGRRGGCSSNVSRETSKDWKH